MSTNKKLIIAIACLCVVLISIVTTLVVVLVSSPQQATSGVNMTYTSTDVYLEVTADYKAGYNTGTMTTSDGSTTLIITPDSRSGSFLQLTEQIEMASDATPNLEYSFHFTNPEDTGAVANVIINTSQLEYTEGITLGIQEGSEIVDISMYGGSIVHPGYEVTISLCVTVTDISTEQTLSGNLTWNFSRMQD